MNIDKEVIDNIKEYITDNDISLKKLAEESKIPYHRLWTILNQNYTITIGDYVSICIALREPFGFFIPNAN